MKYEKKIIILGEVSGGYSRSEVKGTLTIERKERLRCMLSVFNLKDAESGEYLLGITCKNRRTEVKNLGRSGRISTMFEISDENELDGYIRAVLAHANSDRLTPIAFGSNDNKKVWVGNMLDGIVRKPEFFTDSDTYEASNEAEEQKNEEFNERLSPFIDIVSNTYEDSAVATKNFYPQGYGESLAEAGFTSLGGQAQKRAPFSKRKGETIEQQAYANNAAKTELYVKRTAARYYEQIRAQVEELFRKYPPAQDINALLPDTKWVKVDYDGNGKYYVIGLIGSEPSYICYGVPATYTPKPPPELDGFCQWFPLDSRKPEGSGYWLMYQDASNGASVAVEII